MAKPRTTANPRRKPATHRPPQLPSAVEGRVAEICRDLAIQAKRMRELQEEADELRMAIGEWASQFDTDTGLESTRAGRR